MNFQLFLAPGKLTLGEMKTQGLAIGRLSDVSWQNHGDHSILDLRSPIDAGNLLERLNKGLGQKSDYTAAIMYERDGKRNWTLLNYIPALMPDHVTPRVEGLRWRLDDNGNDREEAYWILAFAACEHSTEEIESKEVELAHSSEYLTPEQVEMLPVFDFLCTPRSARDVPAKGRTTLLAYGFIRAALHEPNRLVSVFDHQPNGKYVGQGAMATIIRLLAKQNMLHLFLDENELPLRDSSRSLRVHVGVMQDDLRAARQHFLLSEVKSDV